LAAVLLLVESGETGGSAGAVEAAAARARSRLVGFFSLTDFAFPELKGF
jgi:hypothetical protein